jgi:myo-inositol-1(or 4)-monophosphatase
MTAPDLLQRSTAAQAAVMAQTALMHREFGRVESRWKQDGTRVTTADVAISENIFRELGTKFPDDQFFSEESDQAGAPRPRTARFSWVLDPIDGTNNFALGLPNCAIALALLEHGQPVYGVIYDLAGRQLIHGGPGMGVQCGGQQTRVRTGPLHAQSLIGFHSPYDKRYAPHAAVLAENFKLRGLGSSTLHLAYVAAGLIDGVVDHNVKVWDIAAAVPLVIEAGGQVEFITKSPFPLDQFDLRMERIFYVAGSPTTCAQLRTTLGI